MLKARRNGKGKKSGKEHTDGGAEKGEGGETTMDDKLEPREKKRTTQEEKEESTDFRSRLKMEERKSKGREDKGMTPSQLAVLEARKAEEQKNTELAFELTYVLITTPLIIHYLLKTRYWKEASFISKSVCGAVIGLVNAVFLTICKNIFKAYTIHQETKGMNG